MSRIQRAARAGLKRSPSSRLSQHDAAERLEPADGAVGGLGGCGGAVDLGGADVLPFGAVHADLGHGDMGGNLAEPGMALGSLAVCRSMNGRSSVGISYIESPRGVHCESNGCRHGTRNRLLYSLARPELIFRLSHATVSN